VSVTANYPAGSFYLNNVEKALPYRGTAYLGDTLEFKALNLVQLTGERLRFNHWVGPNGQTNNVITNVTVGLDSLGHPQQFQAVYDDQFLLTTATSPAGLGWVKVTPQAPNGGGYYNQGTVLTLQAGAREGYFFAGYSSPVAGLNTPISPLSFTIDQPTAVTAHFAPVPVPIPEP
jgi:hypothetical protein